MESKGPVIYNTYQCYLMRTKKWLEYDIESAQRGNYMLGIKLVRGAYIKSEENYRKQISKSDSIIWDNKELTDKSYNSIMVNMIETMQEKRNLSLMIATHNRYSVETAIQQLEKYKTIPKSNIFFAQILGKVKLMKFYYVY